MMDFNPPNGLFMSGAVLALLAITSPVLAQGIPALPGAVQPGRDRPPVLVPTQPDFDFSIESPHRSAVGRAVDQVQFVLKDIRVSGAKTFTEDELRPLYAALIGKEIKLANVLDVADAIEQLYRQRGYILVRAFVPPQRVRDGVFTINVVEGKVANVAVTGGTPATQNQIKSYMRKSEGVAPLPLTTMERSLLLSNDLPGVAASGVLRPSQDIAGASDIDVSIAQPRVTGGIGVDNRGSRFSGLWTVAGDVAFNSLLGSDQLGAFVTTSPNVEKQVAGQLRYRRAIGEDGLIGSLTGTITHGQPGSTLTAFNVFTDSWAVGPHFSYPVIRTRAETLQLDGGFTFQEATIDLLGSRISHDRWRVLDASVTYLRANWLDASWLGTLGVAQGIPGLGATPSGSTVLSRKGGATDFTKLTGFGRVGIPLPYGMMALLTGQGQFSFSPLLNGELISFGGVTTGRGYDPGAITGDHGLGGSLELRYQQAWTDEIITALEPYIYVDGGQTWYIQRGAAADPALLDQAIASVGGGVRVTLPHNASLGLEVSRTLQAVAGSDVGRAATKAFVTAGIRF